MGVVNVQRVRFCYLKVDLTLVVVGRVCFDYRKACTWLVEVHTVGFNNRKACIKLVELRRVCFDYGYEACKVGRVSVDYCNVCMMPACFNNGKVYM